MHAVILTGGKQYRVTEGEVLSVEKLGVEAGGKVHFDQVLLIETGDDVLVGTPFVAQALVRADVLETFKDDKVLVFKKKRRKQYRRTRGHRQILSRVRVERIVPDRTAVAPEELKLEAVAPAPAPAAPAPARRTKKAAPAAPKAKAPAAAKPKPAPKPKAAAPPKAPAIRDRGGDSVSAAKAPAKPKAPAKAGKTAKAAKE